jgi:hypothetical protein
MALSKSILLLLFLAICPFSKANEDDVQTPETVKSDFAIIGGGSSGTYAAIRLQQLGHTVTVIEKDSRLGGHVNTFVDPVTGSTFDYGVISFDNISVVTDYFNYLNVPIAEFVYAEISTVSADFTTGIPVPDSSLPTVNVTAALLAYLVQLDKYPYLNNGFNLPTPVPEDLLITWGDFLEKYDLGGLAFLAFTLLEGVGNILAQPTLYMMKYLARQTVENVLGVSSFLSTTHQDNQQLYDNALSKLGSNVYLSSNTTHITRLRNSVEISVLTPSGPKLIQASKLLIAIQPKLENLSFLDLDYEETSLFAKFNNSYYWDAVIRNTGIPDGVSVSNVNLAAPYTIPSMPGLYGFEYSGVTHLHSVYSTSPYTIPDDVVKADMLATLARLSSSLGYEGNGTTPEIVGFNNHAPFELTVSVDEVREGFYDRLNALQGKRNTFWTGATWQLHDSSEIWNWTEYSLLPQLLHA